MATDPVCANCEKPITQKPVPLFCPHCGARQSSGSPAITIDWSKRHGHE